MKLKTLLLFWQNLFCKIFLLLCLIGPANKAYSQTQTSPGIIESFERLLEVHNDRYTKNKIAIAANAKPTINLTELKNVKLDPKYVQSLVMHSDERFLKYAQKDECKFLSSLENSLLKSTDPRLDYVLIQYQNKQNQQESTSILKDDFFEQIYKLKCINNKEFSVIFTELNFKKTIEGIKFSIPKNKSECLVIHNEWLDNPYTPYLCKIQQIIKRSPLKKQVEFYREKIPLVQRIYLDNLCNSLSNPELFCSSYLKEDVWSKILNSEMPEYKMSYKCQQMYNKKETLSTLQLRNCGSKLATDKAFCETRGSQDYPSNFPYQNCENLSRSLVKSKLVTNYHDCPGNIDNEGLTNIHRIINHFSPRNIITSPANCAGETNYTLAKLNLGVNFEEGWPLKVCYLSRVDNKEKCETYIPGSRPDEPLSEDRMIARILYQNKGAPSKTNCKIVDKKDYNPLRSEYKSGCFILNSAENCSAIFCEKKVIWDTKEQADIKFIGVPIFDYFPTTYKNERYAFTNLINEVHKTQDRMIRNLTDIKYFLNTHPNGIVHGVGCIEDLIPEQFQRIAINQCRPMPFIIDGHSLKNDETWLVGRIAIDDIHTPRTLTWPNVFNAVSAYQELHPLNTWTLYGIRK